MSQHDDAQTQKLQQQLETLKEDDERTDWLRDLVGWLLQEMLNLEFKEFLGAEPYERSDMASVSDPFARRACFATSATQDPKCPE